MRAGVFVGVGEPLQVEELTALPPGERDVVVAVDASGVCHTDAAIMDGHLPYACPSILGHEVTGTVVEVGAGVRRVQVGDRVISAGIPVCGDCFFCIRGESHLCEETFTRATVARATRPDGTGVVPFAGLGGFADAMVVAESSLVTVRSDLPAEQLALVGCAVTTGVGAVLNTAQVVPGSTVVVVGCGGVGQCVVQGARIAGATRLIAVDPVASKRAFASAQGATHTVDPADGDPVEQVRALTGGRGADYAFEVVGRPETFRTAYDCARRGGTVVLVGMPPVDSTFSLPGMSLFLDAKQIRVSNLGSAQIRRDIPRLVELAETGRLDLGSMISRRITLDELNDAVRAMEAGEVIRSVIVGAPA
jgi:S-(hydroxymethyl)glutathione dehydrogenase / alcohol dehydrogenase